MLRKLIVAGALGALLTAPALAESAKPKTEGAAIPPLPSAVQELTKDVLLRIDGDGNGRVDSVELDAARASGQI